MDESFLHETILPLMSYRFIQAALDLLVPLYRHRAIPPLPNQLRHGSSSQCLASRLARWRGQLDVPTVMRKKNTYGEVSPVDRPHLNQR